MKASLLPLLRCPATGSPLSIQSVEREGVEGEIQTGVLAADEGRTYRIVGGIPHLYSGFRSADEASTVTAFGDQWARYDDYDGFMGSPDLFSEFSGLTPKDVAGRRVLEVGCGGGRWLKVLASWGASAVVGLDYSAAVEQAARRTAGDESVHIVRGSALALPFAPAFDLVVSIGVVHHLDDPVVGLHQMERVVGPAHVVAIWVYGREGNELYLRVVSPVRRLTPRVPRSVLVGVSRGLAVGVWAYARGASLVPALRLPMREYCGLLRRLRFRDLESVVHDQLTPSLARYSTRQEVESWVQQAGGVVTRMYHRRANSWQCHFRFPAPSR